MKYVGGAITVWPVRGKVLEVGSYDVNGSVRPLFKNRQRFPSYTGIDMREGPGVDMVGVASDLPFDPESSTALSPLKCSSTMRECGFPFRSFFES